MKESILEVKICILRMTNTIRFLDGISLSVFAGERIAILWFQRSRKIYIFLNLNGVLHSSRRRNFIPRYKITRKTLKNCVSISVLSFRIPIIRSLLLPFSLKSLLVL